MQIPYDLEFVENRPAVAVRAVALDETYPRRPVGRPRCTGRSGLIRRFER